MNLPGTKWRPEYLNEILSESNPSLMQFALGTGKLYYKDNYGARKDYARGIFVAAQLTPGDYERMQKVGLPVSYDTKLTPQGNAFVLADLFINMDITQKEKVLNFGVWPKFEKVNAPSKKQLRDPSSQEYKMYMLYYNLGFYILSDYELGNKEIALDLRNKKKSLYDSLFNIFKYDTASNEFL